MAIDKIVLGKEYGWPSRGPSVGTVRRVVRLNPSRVWYEIVRAGKTGGKYSCHPDYFKSYAHEMKA